MANIVKQPCDEAVIRSAPCTTPCSRNVGRWVLAATILGSSMAMIDGSVVNVARTVLQTELNATTTDVQWIVESYALFLAALILVGGSLGDRYVRRRIFACAVALFALASIWCGLSPNVNHPLVLSCLAVGALTLSAFIFVEASSRTPMMPLSLFKSRTFSDRKFAHTAALLGFGRGVFVFSVQFDSSPGLLAYGGGRSLPTVYFNYVPAFTLVWGVGKSLRRKATLNN